MKVIADRASNWRYEFECSDCDSSLEVECADLSAERPTAEDERAHEACELPYDAIYEEPLPVGYPVPPTPVVVTCKCGACGARLVLDPEDLPVFVLDRLVGNFITAERAAS